MPRERRPKALPALRNPVNLLGRKFELHPRTTISGTRQTNSVSMTESRARRIRDRHPRPLARARAWWRRMVRVADSLLPDINAFIALMRATSPRFTGTALADI